MPYETVELSTIQTHGRAQYDELFDELRTLKSKSKNKPRGLVFPLGQRSIGSVRSSLCNAAKLRGLKLSTAPSEDRKGVIVWIAEEVKGGGK